MVQKPTRADILVCFSLYVLSLTPYMQAFAMSIDLSTYT